MPKFHVYMRLLSRIPRSCVVDAETEEEAIQKAQLQVDRSFGYAQKVEVVSVSQRQNEIGGKSL